MTLYKYIIAGFYVCLFSSLYSDTIKFRAYSLNGAISELVYFNNEERTPLIIPGNRRSNTYEIPTANSIDFYDKNKRTLEDGIAPVASVEIPDGSKNILVIFLMNKDKTLYKVFAYDDSLDSLKSGHGLFINLTDSPLGIFLGESAEDKLTVNAYGSSYVTFNDKSVNIRIRVANVVEDSLNKAMDSRIFPSFNHRDIYFIYPVIGKSKGLVRLKMLRENQATASRAYND